MGDIDAALEVKQQPSVTVVCYSVPGLIVEFGQCGKTEDEAVNGVAFPEQDEIHGTAIGQIGGGHIARAAAIVRQGRSVSFSCAVSEGEIGVDGAVTAQTYLVVAFVQHEKV